MKIIIVGSGISGLSVYHFLQKHINPTSQHTIKIYEAYPKSVRAVGGGLGLAPNGIRALHALDPSMVDDILLAPGNSFSRGTFTIRNSQGTTLTKLSMGTKERYGFPNIMIARSTIYSALERNLPLGAVTHQKRVASIHEEANGVEVRFEDGTIELADLVIGADGVRSTVRPAIVGEGFEAEYRGLTGIGGFLPVNPLPQYFKDLLQEAPVVMTFGRDGFFGYAPYTTLEQEDPRMMWWSTFSSTVPPPRDLPVEQIREQLLNRHQDWVTPGGTNGFKELITLATDGTQEVMVLPTYITPPLPRYSSPSGRLILIGDAAHAMPPDSGQGASLALEDSQALVLLLKHYLDTEEGAGVALEKAARSFEALRKERAETILVEAKKRGDRKKPMKWWEEYIRDWVLWGVGFMPERWHDWKLSYSAADEVEKFLATQ